ncbi:MAG TPA: 50S ribosomal protein L2 [Bacteroidetes bacterium]|nr:50S ribosomal protein L2 [Bacteroidota bacterium]
MGLKKFKPITPGTRFRSSNDYSEITTSFPEKSLLAPIHKKGGRNHDGKMTIRNVGGGHKKRFRVIDFKRNKDGVPAKVNSIEYDPNRTSFIALLHYVDGEKRYILSPKGLKVGQELVSGPGSVPEPGNAMGLSEIPLGTFIHNIEMTPGKGGQLVRSAGSSAQLNAKDGKYAVIKMPSGEIRMILLTCRATIGVVSNGEHSLESIGKAGRNRHRGRRPRVRGVAMNPVDHPMGGGEGKSSGGHPRSRNGVPAKGYKTRNKKKASSKLIINKRKK